MQCSCFSCFILNQTGSEALTVLLSIQLAVGNGPCKTQTVYKHASDTPKRWLEQFVPWMRFKFESLSLLGAYISAGREQVQTWKSCVYSLLCGHVRVHQEEHAAEGAHPLISG